MGKQPTRKVAKALSKKLHSSISVNENDCWLWQGCTTRGGYGLLNYKYSNYYTHRLMAALYSPEFKETDHVMHECDTRACMNPDHLILGSIVLNNKDMWEKGRARPTGRYPLYYKGQPL